ncbi:hypothetical protein LTR66_001733, partial [Elasticomyces elasticus]
MVMDTDDMGHARLRRLPTDSMVTIALSEPDQASYSPSDIEEFPKSSSDTILSQSDLNDILATPKSKPARHLRRPSSLEMLMRLTDPAFFGAATTARTSQQVTTGTVHEKVKDAPSEVESYAEGMGPRPVFSKEEDVVLFGEAEKVRITSSASAVSVITTNTAQSPPSSIQSLRRTSSTTDTYTETGNEREADVDWTQLSKQEVQEQQSQGEHSDESTAFLLARLEQENALLAHDPKSGLRVTSRARSESRPPSLPHLKRLFSQDFVHAPGSTRRRPPSVRLTHITEPPPMTELEFWAALVQDYPQTAQRLPTLTSNKIRAGIPPPLRGVVWVSVAGARDRHLEAQYECLLGEKSPYEGIINKDLGRSFPGVEMFMDADGEGQKMLGRVLKCFSLWDEEIGYCQGLGFLVGPLLMCMGDREAFCVLVRLMTHYGLRTSYLPTLHGLHLRIFQFSHLFRNYLPILHAHLSNLGVEPAYLSQWFLSFFATTCPLPILFRIYDVIFAEGANETLLRVSLALMQRNQQRLLAMHEFEEVMQVLLSRRVWELYASDSDELVDEFTSLGSVVTPRKLADLERRFENEQQYGDASAGGLGFGFPDVSAAASRFLGRLWTPSHVHSKSMNSSLSPNPAVTDRSSFLRWSPSKSTLNGVSIGSGSAGSMHSITSTAPTEVEMEGAARLLSYGQGDTDVVSLKSQSESLRVGAVSNSDRDLHGQIEDLLTALSEMQREQASLAAMLQKEREERSEDHRTMRRLVDGIHDEQRPHPMAVQFNISSSLDERRRTMPLPPRQAVADQEQSAGMTRLLDEVEERLRNNKRFSTTLETKAQLRSSLTRTRQALEAEQIRSADLSSQLEEWQLAAESAEAESASAKDEVKELRARLAEDFRERQRLERTVAGLRQNRPKSVVRADSGDLPTLARINTEAKQRRDSVSSQSHSGSVSGLREFKLKRTESSSSIRSLQSHRPSSGPSSAVLPPSQPVPVQSLPISSTQGFAKRTSSLAAKEVLATEDHAPVGEEVLLLELVNAKTAEATARQELDELRGRMEGLKRQLIVAQGVAQTSQ